MTRAAQPKEREEYLLPLSRRDEDKAITVRQKSALFRDDIHAHVAVRRSLFFTLGPRFKVHVCMFMICSKPGLETEV
jgi:hypothetical protein